MGANFNFHQGRFACRQVLCALLACQLLLSVQLESAKTLDSIEPLSLKDALDQLEQTSPQWLLERALAQRAHADRRQVQAALLPQLNATGRQVRQRFANPFAVIPGERNPGDDFRSRIELTQVIFDIQKWSDFGKADTAHELSELSVMILGQDLKQQLVHFYYAYQKAQAELLILNSNQERADALVDLAQARVRAGTATRLEQTRAEVRVTSFERDRIEIQLAAEEALSQIKLLLGLEMDQTLHLKSQAFAALQQVEELPQWYESLAVVESLPEWRFQSSALRQAKIVARAANFKNLPVVEAFAHWGYDSDQPFDGTEANGWMVGLSATIPLYEGGKLFAERKEARAAMAEKLALLNQTEKTLQRALSYADYAVRQRYKQLAIAAQAVELGHAEVTQAEEEYLEGLVDNRALIDAQQALADSELAKLTTVFNFALSRLNLARALGRVERVLGE